VRVLLVDAQGHGLVSAKIASTVHDTFHALMLVELDRYDQRVRLFFRDKPKERFLVFDVFAGHGWPELCAFLGAEPPAIPFPFENRAPEI
jgi:hypothetical protein